MSDDKKFEITGGAIVSTGKKTEYKEKFEQATEIPKETGMTVEEIYDRYSRLLYLIDASGSMGQGMAGEDRANQYLWSDGILNRIRAAMEADGDQPDVDEFGDEDEISDGPAGVTPVSMMSDEDLKNYVVDNNLHNKYGVHLRYNPSYHSRTRSKMQAVKEAARDFVSSRFRKYPDALVTLFSFEGHPQLLSNGANEADVIRGIDRLPDGGGGNTDIFAAVECALGNIEAHPSKVKRHHIVLVSDGLDNGALRVPTLLPRLKASGVVFDFIFILGTSLMEQTNPEVIECLRGVCEQTGGEFQTVKTEKDFTQKFLAASNRKMLPAYAGK